MKKYVDIVVFVIVFAMALAVAVQNSILGVGYAEENINATASQAPRILTSDRVNVLQAPYQGAQPIWVIGQYNELTPVGSVMLDETRWEAILLPTGEIGYVEQEHLLYDPMAAIIYTGVPIWATPEKINQCAVADGTPYRVIGEVNGYFVLQLPSGGACFVDTEQVEGMEPMPASAPASAPYVAPTATPVPTAQPAAPAAAPAAEEEYFFPPQMEPAPVFTFEDPTPVPVAPAAQSTPAYTTYQPAQAAPAYQAPAQANQAASVYPAQAYPATQPAQAQVYQPAQAAPVYQAQASAYTAPTPAYQAAPAQAQVYPTQVYQPAQATPTQQVAPAPIYVGGTVELHGVVVYSRADFQVNLGNADGGYQVLAMENGYLVISFPFGGEQVLGFVPTSALWGR